MLYALIAPLAVRQKGIKTLEKTLENVKEHLQYDGIDHTYLFNCHFRRGFTLYVTALDVPEVVVQFRQHAYLLAETQVVNGARYSRNRERVFAAQGGAADRHLCAILSHFLCSIHGSTFLCYYERSGRRPLL